MEKKIKNFTTRSGIVVPESYYMIKNMSYTAQIKKLGFFGGLWISQQAFKDGKDPIEEAFYGNNIDCESTENFEEVVYNFLKENVNKDQIIAEKFASAF